MVATAVLVVVGTPLVAAARPIVEAAGSPSVVGVPPEVGGSTMLPLDVVLKPRDGRRLASLAMQVSTPGSANFRRYLSPAQFTERFGASPASIRVVEATLRQLGLRPTGVSANHLLVHAEASARAVERAFSTRLSSSRRGDGSLAITDPIGIHLPQALRTLVGGVVGLETTASAHAELAVPEALGPTSSRRSATSVRSATAFGPTPACLSQIGTGSIFYAPPAYTTGDLARAYGYNSLYAAGDFGAGATVALIEFAPYIAADITAFESCLGLSSSSSPPAPSITTIPVDESRLVSPVLGLAKRTRTLGENQLESELDIETLIGLAPGAAIHIYEAPDPHSATQVLDTYAAAVDDASAQVISTSWGSCEEKHGVDRARAEALLFEQAAVEGKTITAAAGDNGSEDCHGALHGAEATALATDDPASQPFVTAVGGTTLQGVGPPPGEVVWNNGTAGGAGGGGVSSIWQMPGYQSQAAAPLGVVGPWSRCPSGSVNCREVPDVAADAGSGVAVYCTEETPKGCSPGWTAFGGTSLASPTWAALFALADASNACAVAPIGFANPALYAVAGGSHGSSAFNAITSGTNDLGFHPGSYLAGPGYNLATGLGSPIAGNGTDEGIVAQLCAQPRARAALTPASIPVVGRLHPTRISGRGGTRIVISGSQFTGATEVTFGDHPARAFTVISASSIVAIAPAGRGHVAVRVRTAVGPSWRSAADVLAYQNR